MHFQGNNDDRFGIFKISKATTAWNTLTVFKWIKNSNGADHYEKFRMKDVIAHQVQVLEGDYGVIELWVDPKLIIEAALQAYKPKQVP